MAPHLDEKKSPTDVDPSTDMYDTVDWLIHNVPNNNGRVGIWGISYPGFNTAASIIDSHPAIKAASPQAPMINLFGQGDDAYHGGAFMLAANFSFYSVVPPAGQPHARTAQVDAVRVRHGRRLRMASQTGNPRRAEQVFPTRNQRAVGRPGAATIPTTTTGRRATSPRTSKISTAPC